MFQIRELSHQVAKVQAERVSVLCNNHEKQWGCSAKPAAYEIANHNVITLS